MHKVLPTGRTRVTLTRSQSKILGRPDQLRDLIRDLTGLVAAIRQSLKKLKKLPGLNMNVSTYDYILRHCRLNGRKKAVGNRDLGIPDTPSGRRQLIRVIGEKVFALRIELKQSIQAAEVLEKQLYPDQSTTTPTKKHKSKKQKKRHRKRR